MLAEFLKAVVELARSSKLPHKLETGERNATTYLIDGKAERFQHDRPVLAASFLGVDDLGAALSDMSLATAPEVYHSEAGVVALVDRLDRRESVRLGLPMTETFSFLCQLASSKGVTLQPKEMIRYLRNTFGAASPEHVVQAIRRIDFTRTSAGKSHVEHGKESLGRSVEAAVQQADQVPEGFVVRTRVYSTPGIAYVAEVRLSLYLDMDEQAIEVRVLPDEIKAALQRAQGTLHEALVVALPGTPIFYGAP